MVFLTKTATNYTRFVRICWKLVVFLTLFEVIRDLKKLQTGFEWPLKRYFGRPGIRVEKDRNLQNKSVSLTDIRLQICWWRKVGDGLPMLVTGFDFDVGDIFWRLVPNANVKDSGCWWPKSFWQNGQNRHQHRNHPERAQKDIEGAKITWRNMHVILRELKIRTIQFSLFFLFEISITCQKPENAHFF